LIHGLLGYAVTDHTAQGRTVHTGLAVITGTEDRQHAYVALSRGTDVNLAYVFTTSPKRANPAPGPGPAPELARYDQIYPERTGVPASVTRPAPPGTAETTPARNQRYWDLLLSILPPGDRCKPSHQAKWLWRTLRAAELAGLDVAQVLTYAIALTSGRQRHGRAAGPGCRRPGHGLPGHLVRRPA